MLGYYKIPQNIPYEEITQEVIDKYNFPIIKCDDFGHNTPNTTLPIGAQVKLDADKANLEILENYLA